MQKQTLPRQRHHEQGQTMIFVAISLLSLLAMAALAIDIVTLYVSRSEIQRAADAAALAGVKALADSGITTLLLTDGNFAIVKPWAENIKDKQIDAILSNNLVAGQKPTVLSSTVDWSRQGDPQITVNLQRLNLPTFFARIWAGGAASVTATATAEAYNPANVPGFTPIAPKGVKPWLVANVDPVSGLPFIDAAGNVKSGVVGAPLNLTVDCQPGIVGCTLIDNPPGKGPNNTGGYPQVEYVPALVTPNAGSNVCPACAGGTDYEQSIECADVTTSYTVLACGGGATNASWDNTFNPGGAPGLSELGTECLIHATATGNGKGQDELNNLGPWPTSPMTITAGSGPQDGNFVTTSSSIVTIPIVDTCGNVAGCFPPTGGAVTIDGYMQAFIDEVRGGPPTHRGDIKVTILNIAGCSATNNGANPILGDSGSSPVPVRLITPP